MELNSHTAVDVGEEEQTLTCTYILLKDLSLILPKPVFCYSALESFGNLMKVLSTTPSSIGEM